MKKLYFLDNEERNRILNLHESSTKKQYLNIVKDMDDMLSESKYWGVSEDGNILYASEKMYVKEDGEMKVMDYDINSLPYILETARKQYDKLLIESKISLERYLKIPEKFLMDILESIGVDSKTRKIINEDWHDKFRYSFNLLTENKMFLFENKLNEALWTEVGVICERTWAEWAGQGLQSIGSAIGSGVQAVGSAIGSGIKTVGGWIYKGLSWAAKNIILPIIKQGIIPFLRWLRRNLNTYLGIITEFIASMFPTVVIVKAIWGLIILLDIYEISQGDYDPYDPERKQMPYLGLLFDIISFLTTSAVGSSAKASFKAGNSVSKPLLKKVADSFKSLGTNIVNSCKKIVDTLFGKNSPGIINVILDSIGTVLDNFYKEMKKIFSPKNWGTAIKQTGKELVTLKGLGKLGIGIGIGTTFATLMEEKAFRKGYRGPEIKTAKESLILMTQTPRSEGGFPELGFKGPVNDIFDDNLEKIIRRVQERYGKKVTGTITPDLALVLGIEFGPGMLENIFGKERIKNFGIAMMQAENWLKTKFEGAKKELNKNV